MSASQQADKAYKDRLFAENVRQFNVGANQWDRKFASDEYWKGADQAYKYNALGATQSANATAQMKERREALGKALEAATAQRDFYQNALAMADDKDPITKQAYQDKIAELNNQIAAIQSRYISFATGAYGQGYGQTQGGGQGENLASLMLGGAKIHPHGTFGYDRGDHKHAGGDYPKAIGSPIKIVPEMGDNLKVSRIANDPKGYGNYIEITGTKNGRQVMYRLAHLQDGSFKHIQSGQTIKAGDIIANAGSTGRSTGGHLHLETYVDGERVDPDTFLQNYGGGNQNTQPTQQSTQPQQTQQPINDDSPVMWEDSKGAKITKNQYEGLIEKEMAEKGVPRKEAETAVQKYLEANGLSYKKELGSPYISGAPSSPMNVPMNVTDAWDLAFPFKDTKHNGEVYMPITTSPMPVDPSSSDNTPFMPAPLGNVGISNNQTEYEGTQTQKTPSVKTDGVTPPQYYDPELTRGSFPNIFANLFSSPDQTQPYVRPSERDGGKENTQYITDALTNVPRVLDTFRGYLPPLNSISSYAPLHERENATPEEVLSSLDISPEKAYNLHQRALMNTMNQMPYSGNWLYEPSRDIPVIPSGSTPAMSEPLFNNPLFYSGGYAPIDRNSLFGIVPDTNANNVSNNVDSGQIFSSNISPEKAYDLHEQVMADMTGQKTYEAPFYPIWEPVRVNPYPTSNYATGNYGGINTTPYATPTLWQDPLSLQYLPYVSQEQLEALMNMIREGFGNYTPRALGIYH